MKPSDVVKAVLRSNPNFKPQAEDLPAAIAAAQSSGNIDLALVLKGQ